jgi:hypothetical protein
MQPKTCSQGCIAQCACSDVWAGQDHVAGAYRGKGLEYPPPCAHYKHSSQAKVPPVLTAAQALTAQFGGRS